MANLKAQTRERLETVSTATVCTALYEKGLHAKLGADGKYIYTHKNGASY
jgi:hypothetical protein